MERLIMADIEQLMKKSDSLRTIIHEEILVFLGGANAKNLTPESSFIIADALSDIVGWYASVINVIDPNLTTMLRVMIERAIKEGENRV